MKRATTILLILLTAATACARMGVSRGHDLDALWARAQRVHDLTTLDALRLLESRHVEITPRGDLAATVHRMVWIGTSAGLRAHADLRVPWNSDVSSLDVHLLRTWRDGRWWPDATEISPTAVVETLPYAVDRCPDYAGMRETMLLHDGVELPCLMETAYTITVRGGAAGGADDVFVLAQREPALRVEYRLTAPKIRVATASLHGAPEPVIDGNDRVWTLTDAPRLRLPTTDRTETYEPTLAWSSWPDRASLVASLTDPVKAAATIGDALADTLAARLETVRSDIARARAVAALIDEGVRPVGYDHATWRRAPRPADRTWDTAYGHAVDRTALALGLFEAAGVPARLVVRADRAPLADHVPCAADHDRLMIAVDGPGGAPLAVYDAAHGGLGPGTVLSGPPMEPRRDRPSATLDLDLTAGEDGWTGRGHYAADGALSPYGRMAGTEGEAARHLASVLGAALPGATLEDHTPVHVAAERVEVGFTFAFDPGEPDALGRLLIELGDLGGGALDELPGDVHARESGRESPVRLRTRPEQRLTLRIAPGDAEVVRAPEPRSLRSEAGRFTLEVERTDDVLRISRGLSLERRDYPAADWADLRELILAETDPANRIILIENE